ncbi:unnamed protein product, partial [Amoebophrya sp. A25]
GVGDELFAAVEETLRARGKSNEASEQRTLLFRQSSNSWSILVRACWRSFKWQASRHCATAAATASCACANGIR